MCVEVAPDGSTVAMLTLAPKLDAKVDKLEIIFIVDRSGSMHGDGINKARNAMTVSLEQDHICTKSFIAFTALLSFAAQRQLRQHCRFWLSL